MVFLQVLCQATCTLKNCTHTMILTTPSVPYQLPVALLRAGPTTLRTTCTALGAPGVQAPPAPATASSPQPTAAWLATSSRCCVRPTRWCRLHWTSWQQPAAAAGQVSARHQHFKLHMSARLSVAVCNTQTAGSGCCCLPSGNQRIGSEVCVVQRLRLKRWQVHAYMRAGGLGCCCCGQS